MAYDPTAADAADAYVRRQSLWTQLRSIFASDRPTEAQLAQVSTLAEVAITQVFDAYHLTAEQQESKHGEVKDYAECSSLYGYVLGYAQGYAAARQQS